MNGKMSTMKGVGLGLAIGGATAMVGRSMMGNSSKRKIKRNAKQAVQTMTDMVNSAQKMVK